MSAQAQSRLVIDDPTGGAPGVVLQNPDNGSMVFKLGTSEKMWLHNDGRLDLKGNILMNNGIYPVLYTGATGNAMRYLQLINSPASGSASGLMSGALLISDAYANPEKKLHVKVTNESGIAGATPVLIENNDPNANWIGMLLRQTNKKDWAVYSEAGDFRIWQSNTTPSTGNGTYRFTIKDNGNVGIGTITSLDQAALTIKPDPSAGWKHLAFQGNADNWFMGAFGGGGFYIANNSFSSAQARFVIKDNNIGFGTTSPEYNLDIDNTGHAAAGSLIQLKRGTGRVRFLMDNGVAGNAGKFYITRDSDPNTGIIIDENGNVGIGRGYGTSINARLDVAGNIAIGGVVQLTSDARFKKGIQTLTASKVAKLDQVRGTSYHFRTGEFKNRHFSEKTQIGIIAQELIKIYPELVSKGADGYYSVNYTGLIPVLVEAVKDLRKKNSTLQNTSKSLKADNQAIKAELDTLKARMAALEKRLIKAKK